MTKAETLALAIAVLSSSAAVPAIALDATTVVDQLLAFIEDTANDKKTYKDLRNQVGAATVAAAADQQAKRAEESLQDATDVAAAAPATVAAPDGFSSRVNDSLTNFMPLFGFAVNSISTSEDEKSVTAVYNPIRVGRRGVVSFSTTITEPKASSKLLEQVEQSARTAQTEAIANLLDDFSDLTFSGTYGYQRSDEGTNWGDGHHLWGRHPKLYQNLANELMKSVWDTAFSARSVTAVLDSADFEEEIVERIQNLNNRADNATIKQLRDAFTSEELETSMSVVKADAVSTRDFFDQLGKYKLSHLGTMVANQPQFTITGAYRDRDDLVGGDELVFTAKLEIGSANLNRAMSHYKKRHSADPSYTKLDAYEWAIEELEVQAQNRTSVSVTYKERAAWNPSYPYLLEIPNPTGGDPTEVEKVAMLSVPKGEDLCIKVSWSRTIKRSSGSVKSRGLVQQAAALGKEAGIPELAGLGRAELDVPARIDLSFEFIDVDGDDPLMQDRGIARISYALPLPGGLSLPFTLTYANHSKFLGEQDDDLSTHIGLSYTLPGQ